jgi:hypothetical protein
MPPAYPKKAQSFEQAERKDCDGELLQTDHRRVAAAHRLSSPSVGRRSVVLRPSRRLFAPRTIRGITEEVQKNPYPDSHFSSHSI